MQIGRRYSAVLRRSLLRLRQRDPAAKAVRPRDPLGIAAPAGGNGSSNKTGLTSDTNSSITLYWSLD